MKEGRVSGGNGVIGCFGLNKIAVLQSKNNFSWFAGSQHGNFSGDKDSFSSKITTLNEKSWNSDGFCQFSDEKLVFWTWFWVIFSDLVDKNWFLDEKTVL